MAKIIFDILYLLIMSMAYSIITNNICFVKMDKKNIIINIICNFFIGAVIYYYTSYAFLVPGFTIIMLVNLYLLSRKLVQAILIAFLADLIMIISDAAVGYIVIGIFKIDYSKAINNSKEYIVIVACIIILAYILSKLLNTLIREHKRYEFITTVDLKSNLSIVGFIFTALIAIYTNITIIKLSKYKADTIITLLQFITVIGFSVAAIILMHSNNKYIRNKLNEQFRAREYEQLKEYTSMLEIMSQDLRKFRHDYINVMGALKGYIDADDMRGLADFYETELVPENNIILKEDKSLSSLQYSKINSLKGLISSKIINAQSIGITTSIEITEQVSEVSINLVDLNRIIGILLDNAIEAALLCEVKKVSFVLIKDEDRVSFIVTNSCLKDTPPISKIYEKDFSTKGKSRGMGLKIVKEIIDNKYSNVFLNTKIQDLMFVQNLTIFNKINDNK